MSQSFQLPDDFVRPEYNGRSIANIPATIAAMLDVPFDGLPPLDGALWQPMGEDIERVVLLIVDGFGWNLLRRGLSAFQPILDKTAVSAPITSIYPSTTVAALSSIWTGLAPAQHGMAGLKLFLPDYATTSLMLRFSPTFGKYPNALIDAGLDAENFLHGQGFGEQLTAAGVKSYAVKGHEIIDSALSKMHDRGVTDGKGFFTVPEMFVTLRDLLEEKQGEKMFISAYWPMVDTLAHVYGWDHSAVQAEAEAYLAAFEKEFVQKLSAVAKEKTAVFITSDHGHIVTPPEKTIYIEDHPALQEMLFMKPAGEPRTVYLYAKHGRLQEIVTYINTHLSHAAFAMLSQDALDAGLFGQPPHAPNAADRFGDVVVAMRDDYILINKGDKEKELRLLGRHGGMTTAEMEAIWLGFRL